MKNLFEPERAKELKQRIAQLRPESERQWGKMTPAQALAHCARAMEVALGDTAPSRILIGRLIGGFVKKSAIGNDDPIGRNSPTLKEFIVRDHPDIAAERARLSALIDRFAAGGARACTTHPHSFFGPMTPDEWAILMYKHVDHHLRQFGA
jgi:hypothetical protein